MAFNNVTLKKIIETNSSSGSEHTKWLLVGLEATILVKIQSIT